MKNISIIELSSGVKSLLSTVDSPIIVTYQDHIVFYTQLLHDFLKLNKQNLINDRFSDLFSIDKKNNLKASDINSLTTNVELTQGRQVYLNYNNQEEETINCIASFKAFMDEEKSLTFISLFHINNENILKFENTELKRQNLMKTIFLANMSHEIRTPLSSIIGFSELLLEEDNEKEEEELYQKLICSSGKSLLQLIEDIIDTSKIESGQLKISKSKFELNTFLDEMLTSFRYEKQIRELYSIDINLSKGSEKKELFIFTDETRLRQVLSNLIINAMKFIDKGFIKFGYLITTDKQLQFYVKDTGIGINKDARAKIFERFGQDKSTLERNAEGSGLGLTISKSIIKLLNGEIWLDTETGYGTTFYFTIPVADSNSNNDNITLENRINIPDYSNKTILIVDDIKPNIIFLKSLFKLSKAKIIIASSGEEAIEKYKEDNSISIVLMDIMMPKVDGYFATKAIKELSPNTFIIMQTAFMSAETKEKSFAAGADYFLSKPINPKELFDVINKFFNKE